MKIKHKGFMALAFVVLESSIAPVAFQIGGSNIGVMPFLLYSLLATAAVMVIISFFQDRLKGFRSLFKNRNFLIMLCALGIFSYGISRLTLTAGTLGTTPSISGILYRTYPLMVIALTPLLLRQKVNNRQIAALILGFASVIIVLSEGSVTVLNIAELPYVILVLISASGVAVSAILVNKYSLSSSGFILFATTVSVLFILPIIITMHVTMPTDISLDAWISIVIIGAVFGGVGSTLFYYAYKAFDPSFTSFVMLTVPFFTVVLSFLLLGTPMKPYYFMAAGTLMAGLFIQGSGKTSAPVHISKGNKFGLGPIFDVTNVFINSRNVEMADRIADANRAFAMKLGADHNYDNTSAEIFSKRRCIAFTTTQPLVEATREEIEYINDLLRLGDDESALIGIGDPTCLEMAFEEFSNQPKSRVRAAK